MIIIKINLLFHQYHATAWHHAQCEGLVDWPPAPWRILRAIIAGAYNCNLSKQEFNVLRGIVWKLAQTPPTYYLPPATYLQWRSPKPQLQKNFKTIGPGKVLYSSCFLVPEDDSSIFVFYPSDINDAEKAIIKKALYSITYLGRRESPAVWELVEEMPDANAYLDKSGERIVAAPIPSLSEDELWDALTQSPADVFQQKKQAVFPGVQQSTYRIETRLSLGDRKRTAPLPDRILVSVRGDYPISANNAVLVCEAFRDRLVSLHPETIFTGQDMTAPVRNHDHTFFSPILDRTGRYLEFIELFARNGFSPSAVNAIGNAKAVRMDRGWMNFEIADFPKRMPEHSVWESTTPMFLTRSPKVRTDGRTGLIPGVSKFAYIKDCPEHQALKFLQFLPHLGLEGEASFQAFPDGLGMLINGELVAICNCQLWIGADRMLQGKSGRLSRETGYKVRIEFNSSVGGPIAIGYRCHYGFGSLSPVRERVDVPIPVSPNVMMMAITG